MIKKIVIFLSRIMYRFPNLITDFPIGEKNTHKQKKKYINKKK